MNIPDFGPVVFAAPNRPIMKSHLPNFHFIFGLLMNFVRASALDQLNRLFKRSRFSRSQKEMKMIGHRDKFVKQKSALLTAGKNTLHQNLRDSRHPEKFTPLPMWRRKRNTSAP